MSEEAPKMFALRLSGDGINIEQQIEQRMALQIVQVVMGGGASAAMPSGAHTNARTADRASLSLREYLDEIGAKKKPDQITTIAQFVCEIEGQGDFSREDIRSRFSTAREPPPANFGRDFAVAERNGWVAEVHGKKGRYYVTAKGAQAIKNNFLNGKGAARR
jgi:hypothetical protein